MTHQIATQSHACSQQHCRPRYVHQLVSYGKRRDRHLPWRKCPIGPRSGGITLITALACTMVAASLMCEMLRGTMRTTHQLRREHLGRQAERLLEAGVNLAVQRLTLDEKYVGETWDLSSEEIVGAGGGRVVISIRSAAEQGDALARNVEVVALYPIETPQAEFVEAETLLAIRRSCVFAVSADTLSLKE